jgi:prepilin-type N-terminal cleavage/methylation domain-containing protein
MKMRPYKKEFNRRGFTIIELLVVIAIIAILAAILFPVAATVREQGRQSNTMSKLYSAYQGAKLYYEDEGRFPTVLFGYAEVADNTLNPPYRPATTADTDVIAMKDAKGTFRTHVGASNESVHRGYTFRNQIKDADVFVNQVEPITGEKITKTVYYPVNSPLGAGSSIVNGVLQNGVRVTWQASNNAATCPTVGDPELPSNAYIGQPKVFYAMDAVDIGPMLDADGKPVVDASGVPAYELHYSPDWSRVLGGTCDADVDGGGLSFPRVTQLKYKNPPQDRTVLTYVTHHSAFSRQGTVILMLLNGTARKISANRAAQQLPLNYR